MLVVHFAARFLFQNQVGDDENSIPQAMLNLLSALSSRITQPLRIRVGGNSLDGSKYNPKADKMITFNLNANPADIKNIPVTYGPQLAKTLKVVLRTITPSPCYNILWIGNWKQNWRCQFPHGSLPCVPR